MSENETDRFDDLVAKTAHVTPRADFTARVMDALHAGVSSDPNLGFFRDLPRVAKRIVPAFVLVAAAGAVWAYRATENADEAALGATPAEQIVVSSASGALDVPTEDEGP
jgi:hypothetical protein